MMSSLSQKWFRTRCSNVVFDNEIIPVMAMRRILLNGVLLLMLFCTFQAIAAGRNTPISDKPGLSKQLHEIVDGVEYYYFINENGAILYNDYKCAINIVDDRTTLTLPESLGGSILVALGNGSCKNLVDVEEIKLPSCLRQIGSCAFEGCSSLKSVNMPACLSWIMNFAFKDCENLATIELPAGVNVHLEAFDDWTGLKEITVPEGLMLDQLSFSGCKGLKRIKLPKKITSKDGKEIFCPLFRNCESLETLELPVGVTQLAGFAFSNCKKLSSVVLPDTIKDFAYGSCTFDGCVSLRKVDLPYKLSIINVGMFRGCVNLESIVIPENVEIIDEAAFAGCTSLKEVVLPASIRSIKNGAFDGCHSIRKFKMPASVRDWVLNLRMDYPYDSKKLKERTEIDIEIVKE